MSPLLWTQRQDLGPQPRLGAGAAFDSARGKVVLFGGGVPPAARLADTWEWDGEAWTQVADTGPDARLGHAVAFDSARGRVVLFGGIGADATLYGDTWEWDGEAWTQVADTGPDARAAHRLAFDAGRSQTVLFGGDVTGSGPRDDTWAWDGGNWTQEHDAGPAARSGHGLAFDHVRDQVVLFGGDTGAAVVGDTWTWDGSDWTERAHFGPPACVDASMVFDGSSVLLYGGIASLTAAAAQVFAGTWQWDGERWTERQDIGPGPRWGHAMAFDTDRGRAVFYGGASVPPGEIDGSQLRGDTWEAQGAPPVPPVPPTPQPPVPQQPPFGIATFALTPPLPAADGQGHVTYAIVTLTRPPPDGADVVHITSEPPSVHVPGIIEIPAGGTTGFTAVALDTTLQSGQQVGFSASLDAQVVDGQQLASAVVTIP